MGTMSKSSSFLFTQPGVRAAVLFAAACAAAPGAHAQFDAASVLGYVRDASGAAVPNSDVTLTNTQTRAIRNIRTDGQGRYQFVSVPVGQYTVESTAAGFQKAVTPPFSLTVNAQQRVDLSLPVGAATEQVEVTAEPTLLETETSSRGQVIGKYEIQNLPLNGRSYADLALLVPGVRKSVLENQTTTSREAAFNVNGQRSAFNNFLLDGLDNNNYGTSNQGFANENIPPSPDAIGQFRVETDNYSAEYGRSSGAVINATTRSGTNKINGEIWEYNRNTALNAIGPFNVAGGKPTLIRNQFGGAVGGPILKDRFFYFADYEGTRQIAKAFQTAALPTDAQKAGNLGYAVRNPLTGRTYANGVVPTSDFSPLARLVFAALPAAPAAAGANSYTYASFARGTITDDKGDGRVDMQLTSKALLFARYSQHNLVIFDPPSIPGAAGGNANGNVTGNNKQLAVGLTYTVSPRVVLDARFGSTWNRGGKSPIGVGQASLLTQAGITNGLPTDPQIIRPLNGQSITGYTQFGDQTSNPQFQNPWILDPKVNLTVLRGKQSLKFGYEWQRVETTLSDFNPTFGQDNYNGQFSRVGAGSTAAPNLVANLADFIFGLRSAYQLNNFRVVTLQQRYHFMYVQDDIKVTPKLTINAGLRYEIVTPQWTDGNHQANFDPATATLQQATDGSIYNRALVNTQYSNLGPRFGFAYSADSKTVLRGGYGISYTQFNREGGENLLAYNGPYIVNASINQLITQPLCTSDTQDQTACFRSTQQGYSTTLVDPAAFDPLKAQARYIPRNNPTGYVQSYFAGVQRQIGKDVVLDLAYVGSKGTHLMTLADYNQASVQPTTATCNVSAGITAGCLSLQARRPVANFNTIEIAYGAGFSNYNSLQFKAEERYSKGLYLLNSFTYSRSFDNASGHLETTGGDNSRVNYLNPSSDYGPSGYDQPLNDTASMVWDLPIFRTGDSVAHKLLGGWQATAISTQTSGLVANLNYSPNANQTLTGLYTFRPNLVGNAILPEGRRGRVNGAGSNIQFLNPATTLATGATVLAPTGNNPFGNASRNSFRAPSYHTLDFGLHKSFGLWNEATRLDLRGEAFNVLNESNFYYPDTNRSSATFGQLNIAFPARQLQVAAKLYF